ncbi:MAG: acyl--CoA ligase [Treponema sp.]|jgi:long-chain acyl-CoA synthetase|nr:acyl--CoA ligase [Treponema sp.]
MIMLKNIHTLGELCLAGAKNYGARKALELCRGDRLLQTVSFRALAARSRQLAGLFRSLGLKRGDRIMILAENRPEWPMAAFGAALGGMVFLPAAPRPQAPAGYFRDLGEGAAVKALCVTGETGELAAGLRAPRIYLDSAVFPADGGHSIRVSLGGVSKRLPLAEEAPPEACEAERAAVLWPGGTESSHRELLSLAGGNQSWPRIFPRDRIFSLSSLAERGTLVLCVLAAVLGGASLSLSAGEERSGGIPGELPQIEELPRILELLRPSILIGDTAFLEALYRHKAAALAEGPLSRNIITRPLARYLGGQRLVKTLGGNVRFFGLSAGPEPGEKLEKILSGVHLPRGRILPPEKAPQS